MLIDQSVVSKNKDINSGKDHKQLYNHRLKIKPVKDKIKDKIKGAYSRCMLYLFIYFFLWFTML